MEATPDPRRPAGQSTHAAPAADRPRGFIRPAHVILALAFWGACAGLNEFQPTGTDEAFTLRLMRNWAEHPLRVLVAGTLLMGALGGSRSGAPATVQSAGASEAVRLS